VRLNLIDFDDTFVFSTDLLHDAYNRAFMKILNKSFTKAQYDVWVGQSFFLILDKLDVTLEEFEEVHKYKNEIYPIEYLNEFKFNRALYDYIDYFKDINIICSQTTKEAIRMVLDHLKITWIHSIYDRNDVKNKKPAPDMYIKAMVDILQDPFLMGEIESINIYEDSYTGLRAGTAAFYEMHSDTKYFKNNHVNNNGVYEYPKNLFRVNKNMIDLVSWRLYE